ncbi:MAG: 4Fe-4S binding protein, partial [Oscillospiraceae bacterium]|nr:4Fe-4S binding protein [Oscillospiraceae bacterium]
DDIKKLKEFAETALDKMLKDNSDIDLKLLGNRPYKKSLGAGLTPKAGKNCVKCGLCAKKCPVQAISAENVGTADTKKCISCMRCVKVCPHYARNANKAMLTAVSLMLKNPCSERKECEFFS